jgi:LmbE family N-acetylglucosaminyl deacetylase
LLGAAEVLLETAGIPLYAQVDLELHLRAADAAREQLGERAWAEAWEEGRAMSFEEAVAYARRGRSPAYGANQDTRLRVSAATRSRPEELFWHGTVSSFSGS